LDGNILKSFQSGGDVMSGRKNYANEQLFERQNFFDKTASAHIRLRSNLNNFKSLINKYRHVSRYQLQSREEISKGNRDANWVGFRKSSPALVEKSRDCAINGVGHVQ
jgi:hypothetical protein